eukprot:scaffold10514_cov54-Phaeocystis_antarctica.AAC.1
MRAASRAATDSAIKRCTCSGSRCSSRRAAQRLRVGCCPAMPRRAVLEAWGTSGQEQCVSIFQSKTRAPAERAGGCAASL